MKKKIFRTLTYLRRLLVILRSVCFSFSKIDNVQSAYCYLLFTLFQHLLFTSKRQRNNTKNCIRREFSVLKSKEIKTHYSMMSKKILFFSLVVLNSLVNVLLEMFNMKKKYLKCTYYLEGEKKMNINKP